MLRIIQDNNVIIEMFVKEIENFSWCRLARTMRCSHGPPRHFVPLQIHIEFSCGNRLMSENWPSKSFGGYYSPNHDFWGIQGRWHSNMRILYFPNAPVFLNDEVIQKKVLFFREPNVSGINFESIYLLQHIVCECLTCINGSSIKWLADLNLV